MQLVLEPMAEHHGHVVIDIFNHFITHGMAAYPEEPVGYEFFGRFLQMAQGYPALVATVDAGRVVGFGFLRPIHPASTLRRTAEITYFILPEYTRQGIGTALLNRLIEQAEPMGIGSLVASISSRNEQSIAFHRKNGFGECGRFEQAGRKCGQEFDIIWMRRPVQLKPPSDFRAVRFKKSYTQHLQAPPSKVFPLLCPTREYEWIDTWNCEMVYSDSGFAEDGCIFTTDFPSQGGKEVWVVSHYEQDREIQFVRVNGLRVIRYNITLADNGDGTTTAEWKQIITGLSEKGNEWVEGITDEAYRSRMASLERQLSHFLMTGKMLRAKD